jgi:hypothetical protein
MNSLFGLILIILGTIGLAAAAEASVQPQMYCWDPDSEFPVSCYEEGEEDGSRNSRVQVWAFLSGALQRRIPSPAPPLPCAISSQA